MKNLRYYTQKNLSTPHQVFEYLMDTLKDSIFTWDYFSDFNKAVTNVKEIKDELSVLNSLLGMDENRINDEFMALLKNYPNTRRVLPILIALRPGKLNETPIIDDIDTLISKNMRDLFSPKVPLTPEVADNLTRCASFELPKIYE